VDVLDKKVSRLERKVKAFEETFKQQNLIAQKYNESLIALKEKEEFLTTVIESNKNAIIAINQHHIVTIYNQAAEDIFGYTKEEMLHKNSLFKIIPEYLQTSHKEAVDKFLKNYKNTLISQKHYKVDGKRKDGTIFPIYIKFGATYYDENVVIVANIEDLTKEESLEREKSIMHYKANHDFLTNLPNRLMFQKHLEESIIQTQKEKKTFALLFFDLNKFKEINDTLGHDYGDKVLQIAAKRMRNILREKDFIARLGGDEFVIILPNVSDKNILEKLVLKILKSIEEQMHIHNNTVSITASIGIAIFPDDADNEKDLIKKADIAMYKSKELGHNQVVYFEKSLLQA